MVMTKNKEVYDSLNRLKFANSCKIKVNNMNVRAMTKIINNINKKQTLVRPYFGNGEVLIEKVNPITHIVVYFIKK
jgi:hypothetical protein